MFGTLQFNHSANAGPTFVERADGAAFSALGNNVLQHTACDQCRQKKLRCTGRKTGCERCKACSTECTYTQLFGSNVRRKDRKRTARQNDAATGSQSPASEQQSEADTMHSTAAATSRNSPSPPVQGGNSGDENGSSSSVDPMANPLDATLLEDAAMNSNTSGDEFVFFDLDPSTFDHFHWSPYSIPGIPSPRSTQADTFSFLDPRSSTSTTATRMLSNPINASNSTCAGRCLKVMKALLEELETRMHDMQPCKADVALSFQKHSCIQCTQIVRCKSCYTDPDAMLFLVMICEKLIMLNKKILWYTREGADSEKQLRVGEYDVDQTEEWGSMLQLLTVVQLRKIKALVDDIEKSPAVEGRHAQLIMLKSVKQQVITLLGRIREALFKVVDEP
ncbi:C6 zinc finger domain-containing protein [Fusarium pseudoanthophilum]|uniref:C6 zinc finger domain-containing protein n=1 Tax=Fusarium pseudoanthophilum TaxID=48495 RepID=A0A8H5P6R3_9HYPO|nr:C6 zinc finger domain-containing protein [Fusarium pseudoanthophilum]